MATLLENLETRRDAVAAELAALTSTSAGGKPNATGGPLDVDHVGYKDALYRELRELNEQIGQLGGGAETESYGLV